MDDFFLRCRKKIRRSHVAVARLDVDTAVTVAIQVQTRYDSMGSVIRLEHSAYDWLTNRSRFKNVQKCLEPRSSGPQKVLF